MGSQYEMDMAGLTLVCKDIRINETQPGGTSGSSLSTTELGAIDGATNANAGTGKVAILGTSGAMTLAGALTVAGVVNSSTLANTGAVTVTSASASALTVGLAGATNPVLKVNASTGSQATGVSITGAAAAGGVAVAAISSASDEALTINAKGTGTIGIGSVSTGAVTITPATTVTGVVTPTAGVAAAGGFSVTPRLMHTGGEPAIATTSGTNLDIVTTETYRSEIFVPANTSSTGVAIFNGTAVAGNVQCYLIDSTGAQVTGVLTASTAASGTTAYQRIPWVSGPFTLKGPATYWLAVQGNNSGGDLRTHTTGNFGADKQTGTTYGTLTVATAPTTFTTGLGVIASLY